MLIQGEPGIGKSRLAEELYEWCSHQEGGVARARCYSAYGRLAYAPIAGWLRSEPLSAACSQLPPTQLAELARVLPEILAQHPSIQRPHPLTESWERRHFYAALNAAFGKARGPLLLLIDDLQWCDADSFEWLHSLFRSDSASRILVVGTVRPEETGRTHPLAGPVERPAPNRTGCGTSALAADRRRDRGIGGSGGQPPARYRRFERPLPRDEGQSAFRGGERARRIARPECESRRRLGRRSRAAPHSRRDYRHVWRNSRLQAYELAGLASAFGQSFSLDLLAKASDWDDDSLSAALDELWQRRLIEGQGETHGVAQYDFTHDRLREVTYAELSPVRRRFLHRRIAVALEELHPANQESVSGRLAAHYEAAGVAESAIHHYVEAAEEARHRYADAEAGDLLRRALVLCRNFPETVRRDQQELELLVTLGPVLVTTQGYSTPEVGELYERALLLARRLGDTEHVFPVLSGAWVFHAVRGQLEASRELAQECLDLASGASAPGLSVMGHFLLGSCNFHLGRLDRSKSPFGPGADGLQRGFTPGLRFIRRTGHRCVLPVLSVAGVVAHGKHGRGARQERGGARRGAAGVASIQHGDCPGLRRRCCTYSTAILSGLEFAPKMRLPFVVSTVSPTIFPWRRSWQAGRWRWPAMREPGLARLRQGLETFKASGAELRLPFYHGLLAEACAQAGQLGEALANISSGFAFQAKNGEVWAAAELHRIHGDLLLLNGNRPQAEANYRRSLETARLAGRPRFRTPGSRPAERTAERRLRPSIERFQNASHVKLGL